MNDELNIPEMRAKLAAQKALVKICDLVTKAVDTAQEVYMTREQFEIALARFTEAMWIE